MSCYFQARHAVDLLSTCIKNAQDRATANVDGGAQMSCLHGDLSGCGDGNESDCGVLVLAELKFVRVLSPTLPHGAAGP